MPLLRGEQRFGAGNAAVEVVARARLRVGVVGHRVLRNRHVHVGASHAAAYRGKVTQRLAELTRAGWFLPDYAAQVTSDAEKVRLP